MTPCSGSCAMPSTSSGAGMPQTSRIVGARSVTWVNCDRSPPASVTLAGPVHDQRVARAAEVGADLLAPLERGVACPRPGCRVVRIHHRPAPGVQAAVPLGELQLHLVGQRDAVLHGQLVERAGDRALHAGAVVSPDPDAPTCCPARPAPRSRRSRGRRCGRRSPRSRRRPPSVGRRRP